MKLDLTEVHAAELRILKAVDELCTRHGIRYSIYCGTLLGAVRHKGFIPWDDDVDIAMPLKDYRRFLEVADELPEPYHCYHLGNTRNYYLPWAQVDDKETTCLDTALASLDLSHALSLDVYPFIGAADRLFGVKLQQKALFITRVLRSVAYYQARGDRDIVRRILYLIPYPVRRGIGNLLLKMAMLDPEKHQRIGTVDAADFYGKFEKEDWEEMVRLHFEDGLFPAPAKYDKILCVIYGNYMQLPSENQRGYHNWVYGKLIIDANRSYREYLKEYLKEE